MLNLQPTSTQKLKTRKLRRGMFKIVNAYRGKTGFFSPSPLLVDPVEEARKGIVIKTRRRERQTDS